MEGDHAKKNKKKNLHDEGWLSDVSHVLSAFWVRLSVQINNGLEWLILDSRYYILFNFRVVLALLFFAIKIFEKLRIIL